MTHRTQRHNEVELKFELDDRAAEEVRRHAILSDADHQTRSQSSVYFDTEDGELHEAGYSLRVRQVGDCVIQTVKTNGGSAGLFNRGEWESLVPLMAPDMDALWLTPLSKFKSLDQKLEPVVRSEVERSTWLVEQNGSAVEVALDSGTVSAGDRETVFHELELELKTGDSGAIFDVAQVLSRAVPLEIGVLTKEERGRLLAQDSFGRVHKAAALDLRKDMNAGEVLALIVHECIRHFRLNEALIIADRDPLALHQARVAMRRLRTAFGLFRPAIRQGSLGPIRDELRQFITPFGKARNLDVFLANHKVGLSRGDRRKLRSARIKAYDEVIGTLSAQRTRDMFLNLVEWTASQTWQKAAAATPIRKFAAKRLDHAWGAVKHDSSSLGELEEQQLHRLRIDIKKLRYAVEFLGPLYGKKDVRKFASSLEQMQDCLGHLHDDVISRQIVLDLKLDAIIEGEVTERARFRQLKATKTQYKHLKQVGRFWSA